jgi:glutamine amidotransferase
MTSKSVLIIDYGVGNIFNIKRAFESLGATASVSNDISAINNADRIVLPGVGAFAAGMASLKQHNLIEPLKEAALTRKIPFFGVCLGMQLLMDSSEENGQWQGLGLIEGTVMRLKPHTNERAVDNEHKIPHMGWNTLEKPLHNNPPLQERSIFTDISFPEYFYFVHSYHVTPAHPEHCIAETSYGGQRFCSVITNQNLSGCQFHPERSGAAGLRILRNFLYEIPSI